MKKILKTAVALALCGTNVLATSECLEEIAPQVSLSMREIGEQDGPDLQHIMDGCYQEGLPASADTYTSNMIKRAQTGNPFTCYFFHDINSPDTTRAAVGFGRMPATGYKAEEHADILNHFIDLGVLRKKDEQAGLDQENLERIENRGVGVILPMLPLGLSAEYKLCVLKQAKALFETFATDGKTLPIENTQPHQLIGLFHPDDTLVPLMGEAGFTLTIKEGFKEFYNKPRVVVHAGL